MLYANDVIHYSFPHPTCTGTANIQFATHAKKKKNRWFQIKEMMVIDEMVAPNI